MFDVGFSEILLIGIVALVVFGPEELPRVARTVGHLLGKLRSYVADVKSDISREMEASEMKTLVADVQESARSLQASLNAQARSLEAELSAGAAALQEDVRSAVALEPTLPEALPAPAAEIQEPDLFAAQQPAVAAPALDENQLDLFGQPLAPAAVKKD